MARAGMGNLCFGSKVTAGFCQALIALMPPHSTYIETHPAGGAIMRRKPAAPRSIGVDFNERALSRFSELLHRSIRWEPNHRVAPSVVVVDFPTCRKQNRDLQESYRK